jgi:selenocysteine-specific translation elongation factor
MLNVMTNLNVAILGSPGYAKEFGKKGTESDVTLYNMKKGETTVTMIEASKYPEKYASLYYAASFGDFVILVVDEINASFGETVLTLNCLGKKEGIIIPRNYITADQINIFTKGTTVESFDIVEENLPILREFIMGKALALVKGEDSEVGDVVIDHFFNVRGIGTVALGVVRWGQIHKHDKLRAMPSEAVAQVRSIQRHDTDFDTAEPGNRVGLALKNIEVNSLDRGTVLTNDDAVKMTDSITGTIKLVKFWTKPVEVGMAIHVGNGMQFVSGTIMENKDGEISIKTQKPVVYREGDNMSIIYLNGGNLRIMGSVKI